MSHSDALPPNPADGHATLPASNSNACGRPAAFVLPADLSDQQVVAAVTAALLDIRAAMVRDGRPDPSWIEVAQVLAGSKGDSSHNPLGQPAGRPAPPPVGPAALYSARQSRSTIAPPPRLAAGHGR